MTSTICFEIFFKPTLEDNCLRHVYLFKFNSKSFLNVFYGKHLHA